MHAHVLQPLGPDDVVLLIEAGLQLDQDRHLFSTLGGVRQHAGDARVAARAVQGELDGENVRVFGRRLDEPLHRGGEAVVRVMKQHVAFADHVEDAPRRREARGRAWMEGRIAQVGKVQQGKAQKVGGVQQPGDLVDVIAGEGLRRKILLLAELGQKELPQRLGHRGVHLDAHHLGEAPVPHLLLDQAEQVFSFVAVVDLEIGVPGDPKGVPPQDLDARKQRFQVGPDDLLQGDEMIRGRQRDPAGQDLGHLDPGESLVAVAPTKHHGEGEAQVRDVGKGMPGIDRERGEDREDIGVEVAVQMLPVGAGEVGDVPVQDDAVRRQGREHLGHQAVAMAHHHLAHGAGDGADLGLGGHAVGGPLHDAGRHLLLEPGDPHLEELVQIAAEDGEELDALEQRCPRVERLVQDPPVELEPAQLPVEVQRGVPQVGGRCHGRTKLEVGHHPMYPAGRGAGNAM